MVMETLLPQRHTQLSCTDGLDTAHARGQVNALTQLHEPMQVVGHDDKSQGFCVLQMGCLPQAVDQATGRLKVGEDGLTMQCDRGQ